MLSFRQFARKETHTTATAAPRRLHNHVSPLSHPVCNVTERRGHGRHAAHAASNQLDHRGQERHVGLATRQFAQLLNLLPAGNQRPVDARSRQFCRQGIVPSPRRHLVDMKLLQFRPLHKTDLARRALEPLHGQVRRVLVLYENAVICLCPQRRQESQVGPQPAGSMGGSERPGTVCQRQVVVGIEYM